MTELPQESPQDGPPAGAGALPAPCGRGDTPQAVARASGAPVAVTVDLWPHALTEEGRDTHPALVPAGTTLAELVRLEAGAWREDVGEVLVDGVPAPRERWDAITVQDGQTVTVHAGAEGGNALRQLLQLATLVASVFVPGLLGLKGIAGALASAAIVVVGGLITNALFPVRPPEVSGPGAQPDPVYSLAGGSNRARLYEPLPLVLGEHRVFPDLGAKEYTEYDGDDQYLYQIFNFGPGDLDITELRIDSTPAADYAEVTTERGDARGRIALVAGNVDTTSGAALEDTGWVTRQTGANTDTFGVDITGRLFRIDDDGEEQDQSVTLQVRWWQAGQSPPSQPQSQFTISHSRQSPFREAKTYTPNARGTWNVSVRRTTEPSDEARTYDDITWAALRSYQPDTADYTGQNRLGVRIRASGQLSGRLDRVSAIVKQKIPIWDNVAESWGAANVESSNPAAVFLWYARGVRIGGRPAAGVGLPDSRVDLAGLGAWYEWCHAQGLRCDYEIKGGMTHDAVLSLIAQCGRASVSWQTGKLGVVYEDSARIPSGLVTPGNVVKGSFRYEYAQGEIADEVIVRYIEPDLDWQYNSVRRSRPDLVGTPQSSVTVIAKGVTQRDQAAVECNLQTARQHYHRRRLVWEMGREGRSFTKGSVVWITHSLIDGGITGRLAGIQSATRLRLDKPVDVGADDYLLLRLANGKLHQSRIAAGAGDTVTLAAPLPDDALAAEPVDVLWRLYDNALPPAKARIVAFEPISDRRFRLTAIDEVAAYYALATSDLTAPFPGVSDRIPRVIAVQFSDRRIRAGNGYAVELQAALTVDGDWRGGIVRAGPTFSELAIVDRLVGGDTVAKWIVPSYTGQAVEIIPGAEDQPTGPVWRGSWNLRGVPPAPPTGFAVTEKAGNIREFVCVPPDIPDLAGVRIRFSNDDEAAWADMASLADGPITAFPYLAMKPGGGTWTFEARTQATGGDQSTGVRIRATLGDIPATFAGNTWHTVTGVPDASLGNDGDFAMRIDAGHVGTLYRKADGAWSEIADLEGADGARWFSGSGAPGDDLGENGDWYFRTGSSAEAGTVYRKGGGSWAALFDIGTGRWLSGEGVPADDLGRVGDFYFRTSNGYVYEKTGPSTWTYQHDLTGPSGINGTLWFFGTSAPAASLGNNGDFYLRTSTNQVYVKANDAWSLQTDFSGADGAQWFSGTGVPASTLGSNGDWYFRTGSGSVAGSIYRKVSGSWVKQIDIDQGNDGADGSVWHSGNGAPSGSLGKVGDWYFRTSNGYVYEKTGASTWTFQRDLTGPQPQLADASVTTAHIALSATAELFVAVNSAYNNSVTGLEDLARARNIPGGSGYKILVKGSVFVDARGDVEVRMIYGGTAGAVLASSGRNTVGGGSFSQWNCSLAYEGAHTGKNDVRLQCRRYSGTVTVRSASLDVFLAKR